MAQRASKPLSIAGVRLFNARYSPGSKSKSYGSRNAHLTIATIAKHVCFELKHCSPLGRQRGVDDELTVMELLVVRKESESAGSYITP